MNSGLSITFLSKQNDVKAPSFQPIQYSETKLDLESMELSILIYEK